MDGLLDGVVVLDLTRVLAGPYSAMLLADMGATVIKVENPKGGDDTRSMGPFVNGSSVYYANFNRSKYGCTLNLKEPEGKEIFKEMVKRADVVLENYRPGTMEKLGLGYDVLRVSAAVCSQCADKTEENKINSKLFIIKHIAKPYKNRKAIWNKNTCKN